jgi:hypothetical protein
MRQRMQQENGESQACSTVVISRVLGKNLSSRATPAGACISPTCSTHRRSADLPT